MLAIAAPYQHSKSRCSAYPSSPLQHFAGEAHSCPLGVDKPVGHAGLRSKTALHMTKGQQLLLGP